MSRSRQSNTHKVWFAVGLVSSTCALLATYLYFSTTTASLPTIRRRRKVMVSSRSSRQILDFLDSEATASDDVYITLLTTRDEHDEDAELLNDYCSHLLRHEKSEGLTHISRHISPDLVILLPSISDEIELDKMKDWVGKIAVLSDSESSSLEATNIRHYGQYTTYQEICNAT